MELNLFQLIAFMKFNVRTKWQRLVLVLNFLREGYMSLEVPNVLHTDLICEHGCGCSSSTLGS